MLRTSTVLIILILAASLQADEPIRHSFFIAGPSFTGIIAEDGSEAWNSGKTGARDGYILPNGNALIAWGMKSKSSHANTTWYSTI